MKTECSCFWFVAATGVCSWDLSAPGTQVLCCCAGCRDFESHLTSDDYKEK